MARPKFDFGAKVLDNSSSDGLSQMSTAAGTFVNSIGSPGTSPSSNGVFTLPIPQVGPQLGPQLSPKSNDSPDEDDDEDRPRTSPMEGRRRQALERGPKDGLHMDSEFEAACRQAVAMQRGALASAALGAPKSLGGNPANGIEAVTTPNPSRVQNYLYGDGAVYSQYDFKQAAYAGGSLPEGWLAIRSRSTGKMYFANKETGDTQWEPPLYPVSPEWSMQHAPQSGAVFYEHRGNGKVQWERPVDPLFISLKESLGSDVEALRVWWDRNPDGERAEPGFAGLDQLRQAAAVPALLPPPERAALPAPEPDALPAPEPPA